MSATATLKTEAYIPFVDRDLGQVRAVQPQRLVPIHGSVHQPLVELLDPRRAFGESRVPVGLQGSDLRLAQIPWRAVLMPRVEQDLREGGVRVMRMGTLAPARNALG